MAKPRGRSRDDIDPKHLVDLKNVHVQAIHFEEDGGPHSPLPYFEVGTTSEPLRIRVHHNSHDWMKWLKEHQSDALDLTIFPYEWEVGEKSGVVNYFRQARLHKEAAPPN